MIQTAIIRKTPTIRFRKGDKDFEYILTETDVLDLTRSAWREGEPVAGVIHTLIQRYAATYPKKAWPSLSLFLRDYVQPINPRWFLSGDLHIAYANRLKGEDLERAIERAKAREQYAKTPLNKIPARYKTIVQAVLNGAIKTPNAQAQHFAASTAKATETPEQQKKRADSFGRHRNLGSALDMGVGFGPKVNWFYKGSATVPAIKFSMQQIATKRGLAVPLVTAVLLGWLTTRLL